MTNHVTSEFGGIRVVSQTMTKGIFTEETQIEEYSMNEDTDNKDIQDSLEFLENVPLPKILDLMAVLADSDHSEDFKLFGLRVLATAAESKISQESCSCAEKPDLLIVSAGGRCACGLRKMPHLHCSQCGSLVGNR